MQAQVSVWVRGRSTGVDVDAGCQDIKLISHLDGLIPQPMLRAHWPDTGIVSTQLNFSHECISGMDRIHQILRTDVCVLVEKCVIKWLGLFLEFCLSKWGKFKMFILSESGLHFRNKLRWICCCDNCDIVLNGQHTLSRWTELHSGTAADSYHQNTWEPFLFESNKFVVPPCCFLHKTDTGAFFPLPSLVARSSTSSWL